MLRDRHRLVRGVLVRTREWIATQENEIATESIFMRPGDPDDDWDYDYNICVRRVIDRARETAAALEREQAAIEAEQPHWSRDE